MKVARPLFPSITVTLVLLSLLVLGTPVSGFAQNPHTCKSDWSAHLPTNLGNQPSFYFLLSQKLPPLHFQRDMVAIPRLQQCLRQFDM